MANTRRWWFAAALISLVALAMPAGAQRLDGDRARLIFAPQGQTWYRAAIAMQTGRLVDPADLEAIKPDIDHRAQPSELTLLQYAWEVGNVGAINQLIANGANWRAKLGTQKPRSLQDLLYEVQTSDDDAKAGATLSILLAHGLDPNQREESSGDPILRQAIVSPNKTVELGLVAAGADPWATGPGPMHTTCIQVAIENGKYGFVHWLVERGLFDHRPAGQVVTVLTYLARQPRDFAPDLIDNRDLAAAIVKRTGITPDGTVQSLLRDHPHRG